jgi:hypothetical protein
MLYGFVRDWRHPAYMDLQFAHYADQLRAAQPGETIVVPENPQGWDLRLVKR